MLARREHHSEASSRAGETQAGAAVLAVINDSLRIKGLILRSGTVVDATLISAPSSTKNASGERDPEMHQSKKGNQWHIACVKAQIRAQG